MVEIDSALVRRLVAAQHPRWASLPLEPVVPGGWDNRTFRLGDGLAVRLPSDEPYAAQVEKEQRWLPWLGPRLPLPIPTPLASLGPRVDGAGLAALWDEASASRWTDPPVWLHGDVAPTNLLVRRGRLCAVLDFGALGVGDPACDGAIAWSFFTGESRRRFHEALRLDDATWARARSWALWKALLMASDPRYPRPPGSRDPFALLEDLLAGDGPG